MRTRTALLSTLIVAGIVAITGVAIVAVATPPGTSAGEKVGLTSIVGTRPSVPSSSETPAPSATPENDGPVVVAPVAPHDVGDDHGGSGKSGSGKSGSGGSDD